MARWVLFMRKWVLRGGSAAPALGAPPGVDPGAYVTRTAYRALAMHLGKITRRSISLNTYICMPPLWRWPIASYASLGRDYWTWFGAVIVLFFDETFALMEFVSLLVSFTKSFIQTGGFIYLRVHFDWDINFKVRNVYLGTWERTITRINFNSLLY